MRAPDAGADTLIIRANGSVETVVQAKRYTDRISWSKCQASLERALKHWKPNEVRFVFACDFTEQNQRKFQAKLVDNAAGVRVTAWTLSDLERLLDQHPSIGPRFLGPTSRNIAASVERAARLGGLSLTNAKDVVARAAELANYVDEVDPNFAYSIALGPASMPTMKWERMPPLRVRATEGSNIVEISAWPRPDGKPEKSGWNFTPDKKGQRARASIRIALASGKPVTVTDGIVISKTIDARLIDQLSDADITWTVEITPPTPMHSAVRCDSPHGELVLSVNLFSIPPVKPQTFTAASFQDGIWFEIGILEEAVGDHQGWICLEVEYGSDAARNLDIARAFLKWITRTSFSCTGPISTEYKYSGPQNAEDSALVVGCKNKISVFEMTVDLERTYDMKFLFPKGPTNEEVRQLQVAHEALVSGGGILTIHEDSKIISASELPQFEQLLKEGGAREFLATFEVFGETLYFGPARYDLPPYRIASMQPLEGSASNDIKVHFVPDVRETKWRLIEPLRFDPNPSGVHESTEKG